jgi:glucose 1-dehydrogenase
MSNWLKLDQKVAVVTGGGSGIGRGVALELADAGCRVFVIDLDETAAKETVALISAQTGKEGFAHAADTSDPEQVAAAHRRLRAELGPADVLVNNAGIIGRGELADAPLDAWQRVFDVNVTGYLLCSRAFGADMLERGSGSVVHVTSICGLHPYTGAGAYSPSKAAVSMLSRQLAAEWAARGVRSNAVAPGLIRTPMTEASYAQENTRRAREGIVPIGRIGTPQDIAQAVLWFASERSSYVTGQQVLVDGGLEQTLLSQVQRTALS